MPFAATWMDIEIIILNEVSQEEKDKYHMISLRREIKKIKQIKQKQTHRYREQTGGCQKGGAWGMSEIGEGD